MKTFWLRIFLFHLLYNIYAEYEKRIIFHLTSSGKTIFIININ